MSAGTPPPQGELVLFTGPMASGKTTELHRVQEMAAKSRHKKPFSIGHANNQKNVDRGYVLSRSGREYGAEFYSVLTEDLALRIIDGKHTDVFIDEGQFFCSTGDRELFSFCDKLLAHRITVYVSALNGDFKREPWPAITHLMALSPVVYMFHAYCDDCGEAAHFTHRVGSNTEVVDVHGEYKSLCRRCWNIAHQ